MCCFEYSSIRVLSVTRVTRLEKLGDGAAAWLFIPGSTKWLDRMFFPCYQAREPAVSLVSRERRVAISWFWVVIPILTLMVRRLFDLLTGLQFTLVSFLVAHFKLSQEWTPQQTLLSVCIKERKWHKIKLDKNRFTWTIIFQTIILPDPTSHRWSDFLLICDMCYRMNDKNHSKELGISCRRPHWSDYESECLRV